MVGPFFITKPKFERDLSTSVFTTAISISRPQKCSANFTMEKIVDQRVCLKFCLTNKFSSADSLKMLKKAFGDNCMSKTQAYDWYKSFKDGREVVEDLPRSGRPSTSTTDDHVIPIKKLVLENRHLSVRELARELSIDKMTVHNILTNVLCMKRVAAKLVPKELNFFSHQAIIIKEYKTKNSINTIEQPPYSPDLAPCDFFLFPKLKLPLRGTRFQSIEAIKTNSQRELKAIPLAAYERCMEEWVRRYHSCIVSNGDYFEGDKINIDN